MPPLRSARSPVSGHPPGLVPATSSRTQDNPGQRAAVTLAGQGVTRGHQAGLSDNGPTRLAQDNQDGLPVAAVRDHMTACGRPASTDQRSKEQIGSEAGPDVAGRRIPPIMTGRLTPSGWARARPS